MGKNSGNNPRKKARDRRANLCVAAAGVLAGLVTYALSKNHAALAVATAAHGTAHKVSPDVPLGAVLGILYLVFFLVLFTIASIVAAQRRRRHQAEQLQYGPAPARRRYRPVGGSGR